MERWPAPPAAQLAAPAPECPLLSLARRLSAHRAAAHKRQQSRRHPDMQGCYATRKAVLQPLPHRTASSLWSTRHTSFSLGLVKGPWLSRNCRGERKGGKRGGVGEHGGHGLIKGPWLRKNCRGRERTWRLSSEGGERWAVVPSHACSRSGARCPPNLAHLPTQPAREHSPFKSHQLHPVQPHPAAPIPAPPWRCCCCRAWRTGRAGGRACRCSQCTSRCRASPPVVLEEGQGDVEVG